MAEKSFFEWEKKQHNLKQERKASKTESQPKILSDNKAKAFLLKFNRKLGFLEEKEKRTIWLIEEKKDTNGKFETILAFESENEADLFVAEMNEGLSTLWIRKRSKSIDLIISNF